MRLRFRGLIVVASAFLLALVLGYAPYAFGQTETGSVNGTITDQSHASVPKATVTVTGVNTGSVRATVSDVNGFYNVSNLQPGLYEVTVEAANLAKANGRAEVTVGSRVQLDFQLSLKTTTTIVEVVGAGGVQVNTETATLGTVINSKDVANLPTINRNPYTFAAYAPTASDGDPSGRGVGVAFNGLRAAGTNVMLDGAANNDEFTASFGQIIPLDSVQEYSVLTNNFTAEYGRASSAVINLTTKSGSNSFHGSAYEYNRVSRLAAQDFFDKAQGNPKQSYTRNQFGGSLGGPIKKDKLFFFGNAEWNRIRSSAVNTNAIIDPAFVALANANTANFYQKFGTLRSNARIINTFTMAQAGYCGANPLAQCATMANDPFMDVVSYTVPADAGAGSPQNQELVVGRVDWNVSDKTQVYTRYAFNRQVLFAGTVSNSVYAGYDTPENIQQNNILVSMTHALGSHATSQSKIVFNRLNDFQPLGTQPISPGLYFNPAVATGTKLGVDLMLPGYLPTSPGNGIPFGGPQNFLQFYQDMSISKGRHTLRWGGSYDYQRDNRTFGAYETPVASFAAKGGIASKSVANFLNGNLGQFQGAIYPQGKFPCPFNSFDHSYNSNPANTPIAGCFDTSLNDYPLGEVITPVSQPVFARSNRYQEFAFYGADSWKVSQRFTLNLGLRWEYFGVQHNKNPRLDSNYYMGSGGTIFDQIRNGAVSLAPLSPAGGLWAKDWNNFAPKLGFAWDITGDGKTVIRGGYSIAYERNFGNVTFNVIQNPPNYSVISLVAGVDVPTIPVTTDPAGPLAGSGTVKAIPNVSLRAVNPNIRTSYAHLYSLTLEREIRHNLVAGIDFSGSEGLKLYDIANVNRPGSGNVYEGDPTTALTRLRRNQYSNINFRNDNGKSHYNALVGRVTMNNWRNTGLTLTANYTWSHTLDELSDTFSSSGNEFNLGYLDPFNPKVDYGNSYLDIRHRFAAAAVWELPFARGTHGVVKQIFDGWGVAPLISAETGTPFSIFDCSNAFTVCPYAFNAAGTSGIPRSAPSSLVPTALPDNFIYTPFTTSNGTPLFDSSYANPIVGISDFGPFPANMVARNAFRGPGQWNIDMAITKSFFLTERFRLQFRGELYNTFNHANLYLAAGGGDVDVSSNSFVDAQKGGIGTSHRNVQLALRLEF